MRSSYWHQLTKTATTIHGSGYDASSHVTFPGQRIYFFLSEITLPSVICADARLHACHPSKSRHGPIPGCMAVFCIRRNNRRTPHRENIRLRSPAWRRLRTAGMTPPQFRGAIETEITHIRSGCGSRAALRLLRAARRRRIQQVGFVPDESITTTSHAKACCRELHLTGDIMHQ